MHLIEPISLCCVTARLMRSILESIPVFGLRGVMDSLEGERLPRAISPLMGSYTILMPDLNAG